MPELPEVETSCRGIRPHIQGQVLEQVVIRQHSLRWPVPISEITALEGAVLAKVWRRGKYLLLSFVKNRGSEVYATVLLHLGMSGNLRIVSRSEPLKKHDHLDFDFGEQQVLRLNDPRRFGCCLYTEQDPLLHELLSKLGPEPLSEDFTFAGFYQASRGKTQSIKQWLMDSKTVVGVGNIYACESLFKAKINPKTQAGKVSKARLQRLFDHVIETLAQAIEQGGTTLKDFVGSDGKPGYFKQELLVYGRAGEACVVCGTSIKSVMLGQRNTFYCPKCQAR